MFKKAFWVPYEDSTNYPTLAKTMEAISKYCEENGESYTFINDDEVESSVPGASYFGKLLSDHPQKSIQQPAPYCNPTTCSSL